MSYNNKNNVSKDNSGSKLPEQVPVQNNLDFRNMFKNIFMKPKTGELKIPKSIYQKMDDENKKAVDVLEKEGQAAAIKYMFTDQQTGGTLSYAEMRSRFG